jgi:hypothetical protein
MGERGYEPAQRLGISDRSMKGEQGRAAPRDQVVQSAVPALFDRDLSRHSPAK